MSEILTIKDCSETARIRDIPGNGDAGVGYRVGFLYDIVATIGALQYNPI